jgi:hypothetical protein
MDINEYLKPFDNLLKSINDNKIVLLLIIILLGIYWTNYNEYVVEKTINLFDSQLFRLAIFILISYIAGSSPALGVSLAIIMLVSMQLITNLKFKKEFNFDDVDMEEKFSQIDPSDTEYLSDEYLTNPLELQSDLAPPINFDLKLTRPKDIYMGMIKKGKMLLDDSYDLEQDLDKRFDSREQEIAFITKRNGNELVRSGLNRLQKADQGEYNLGENNYNLGENNYNLGENKSSNTNKSKTNKFIRYSKLLEKNKNNPSVIAAYNDLLYNYDLLVEKQLDEKSFNIQLDKVYSSELELLETVYRFKKIKILQDKQKEIETELNKIKQLKSENKNWIDNLRNLCDLIE